MRYKSLNQLLANSSSSRQYFLSLPIGMQIELRGHAEAIHSADDLHQVCALMKTYEIPTHKDEYEHFF